MTYDFLNASVALDEQAPEKPGLNVRVSDAPEAPKSKMGWGR